MTAKWEKVEASCFVGFNWRYECFFYHLLCQFVQSTSCAPQLEYMKDLDDKKAVVYENADGSVHDFRVSIDHPRAPVNVPSGERSFVSSPADQKFDDNCHFPILELETINLTLLTKLQAGPDNRPAREVSVELLGPLYATLATRDLYQVFFGLLHSVAVCCFLATCVVCLCARPGTCSN